jgi:putative SOS response-associated peptidase YedK
MCGRYTLTIDKSTIEKRFGARFYIAHAEYEPTYNVAPSQLLPIIRTHHPDSHFRMPPLIFILRSPHAVEIVNWRQGFHA